MSFTRPIILIAVLLVSTGQATVLTAQSAADSTNSEGFRFEPGLRSFQLDLAKILVLDVMVNVDVDVFKVDDFASFGIRPQLLGASEFCFNITGHGSNCGDNEYFHIDLLAYGSLYLVGQKDQHDIRLSVFAGASSIRGGDGSYSELSFGQQIYPKLGLEAQFHLTGPLSFSFDAFWPIGREESLPGYLPVGLRIGHARW